MGARLRLVSLWVSHVARFLGDWCLRVVALLQWAGLGPEQRASAWHLATALFVAPFLLLAPLNGPLSNSLPRRAVLVGSATFIVLAVALGTWAGWSPMACLAVTALASAVYSPARYAVLPAAAVDARLPLARVNGCMELGAAGAIVGGLALGLFLAGHAAAVLPVLLGLNLLCLLAAVPAAFPSDVRRPEPPGRAVAGFFRDTARIARVRPAAGALLGLAGFQALVTATAGALVAATLGSDAGAGLLPALVVLGAGGALGGGASALPGHPRRNLGLVPLGATGLLLALAWAGLVVSPGALPLLPCLLLGFTAGLVNASLRTAYLDEVPADARGNGMAVMNTVIYALTIGLALLLLGLAAAGLVVRAPAQIALLALLAAAGAVLAWRLLFRQAIELLTEGVLLPMYRIRAHGPGAGLIPRRGPLLLVANHSSYFDPFWLGKVVPRRLTPLMTSRFFDLPIIRWLMVHVVGAIRVPAGRFRREAPELAEAVGVLRRGGCVLIFPEGMLRRKEEQLLRPFGQGVWRILSEVPQTPVVVCWIEGGWGSYASYRGGLPLKGKRIDRGRRIDLGMAAPQVLEAGVLADQRATRAYLMRACLECRRYLGLEVPAAPEEEGEAAAEEG
jgi:1-acyl-sn-glycerol-3-phosphate acyltransferase